MHVLELDGWIIRYDRRKTEQAYSVANQGAQTCGCLYCRNYVAVRDAVYGLSFRALLIQLGIDPHKEAEVSEAGESDPDTHLYVGFYHFVGIVDRDPGDRMASVPADEHGRYAWQIFFTPARALIPAAFDDSPVVQLEFQVELPWAINERPA